MDDQIIFEAVPLFFSSKTLREKCEMTGLLDPIILCKEIGIDHHHFSKGALDWVAEFTKTLREVSRATHDQKVIELQIAQNQLDEYTKRGDKENCAKSAKRIQELIDDLSE